MTEKLSRYNRRRGGNLQSQLAATPLHHDAIVSLQSRSARLYKESSEQKQSRPVTLMQNKQKRLPLQDSTNHRASAESTASETTMAELLPKRRQASRKVSFSCSAANGNSPEVSSRKRRNKVKDRGMNILMESDLSPITVSNNDLSIDESPCFPMSKGITPAREKAFASISAMNSRVLESRAVYRNSSGAKISKESEMQSFDEDTEACASILGESDSCSNDAFSGYPENTPAENGLLCNPDLPVQTICTVPSNHPVFGKLLTDFGYKRVYRASGNTICSNVPIWHLQRPIDYSRVESLINAKYSTHCFPGVVSIFDFGKCPSIDVPQSVGIFDGQHRIVAVNQIIKQEKEKGVEVDIPLLIEVYPVSQEEEVKRLFQELNKAEMVQEIDLPCHLASPEKVLIDEACQNLYARYPSMFKGERCRIPHIHLATIRNDLFQQKRFVLALDSEKPIKTSNELFDMLEDCNRALARKSDSFWAPNLKRHLVKCRRYNFFLGLSRDWIHAVLGPLLRKRNNVCSL